MNPDNWIDAVLALRNAKHVAAFTGAGISAESGIPTFRDADGFWQRFPPEQFASWNGLIISEHEMEVERREVLHRVTPKPFYSAMCVYLKFVSVGVGSDQCRTRIGEQHGQRRFDTSFASRGISDRVLGFLGL